MFSRAHNARQNAHAHDEAPSQVRVTYAAHPFVGQMLKVVGQRREGDELCWVVQLPDGSRTSLRSSWTDHPVGRVSTPIVSAGVRASPSALRELAALVAALAEQRRAPERGAHGSEEEKDRSEGADALARMEAERPRGGDLAQPRRGRSERGRDAAGGDGVRVGDASEGEEGAAR